MSEATEGLDTNLTMVGIKFKPKTSVSGIRSDNRIEMYYKT
jgi:putative ubiquitin-RnfH superfamily antitoxin RatB of RatAB toxin-antitoxin module